MPQIKKVYNTMIIKQRYTIESWVCDYGIFDNEQNKFIGNPILKYSDAEIILNFMNSLFTFTI